MPSPYKYPTISLGNTTMAQLTVPLDDRYKHHELLIVAASTMDEPGGYCPAENVRVSTLQAIERLRDFLNEHYPPVKEIK